MAELATEYKCPACGGALKFDAVSGKMKCEYCDTLYALEEVKELMKEKNEEAIASSKAPVEETGYWKADDAMKAYACQSCGAELVCDETTAATSCPYCGSPTVMPQQFTDMMKPKYVIPFKVEKKDAVSKLAGYCKGKKLLPSTFTNGNHIDEVKGVYVPFWLYSGTVEADISYDAEKKEDKSTKEEEIILTHHYAVSRKGKISFEKIPADASSKMPDDLMDSIEPYDYKDLTGFQMEYLPGYLADKYDVPKNEVLGRAHKRVEGSAEKIVAETVQGYDSVRTTHKNFSYSDETQEYAMFPVWLLSTQWNNKNFLFGINGQTGKMIGNLPIDRAKQAIWILCTAIPVMILCFVIAYMNAGISAGTIGLSVLAGIIVGALVNGALVSQMKPVAEQKTAASYVAKTNGKSGLSLSVRLDRFVRTTEQRKPIQKNTNTSGNS